MNRKILIVDDEKQIISSLERYLKLLDYKVESLNDSSLAMEKIETDKYFLAILDIFMPKIDGIELLKMIKQYNGAIQVIIMSGDVKIDNLLSCMRRGASDCLFKPFNNATMKIAVEEAFARLSKWERLFGELVKGRK